MGQVRKGGKGFWYVCLPTVPAFPLSFGPSVGQEIPSALWLGLHHHTHNFIGHTTLMLLPLDINPRALLGLALVTCATSWAISGSDSALVAML